MGHLFSAVLLLFALEARAERQFNPNDVIVFADSEAVRAVYAQPVTSDLFALLVARETFRLANDQKAEKALDAYLARVGLLALAGETVKPSGTIERIVTDPSALPTVPGDLASRILSTALTPRLAVSVDAEKHLPDPRMNFQTHKREHPGVWSSWSQERAESIHVLVLVENTGRNRITQFDARLQVDRESAGAPLELPCRPSPWFDSVAPGESRLHVCVIEARRVAIPELVRAISAAEKTPSRWRLVPTRINFADPAVNFGSRGVYYWLDSARAGQQASLALGMAGCRARGGCLEDARRQVQNNPQYILIPAGALAGVLLGWLMARFARRPAIWGAVISLVTVGGLVAVIAHILRTTTGMAALAAVFVGMFGAYALGSFLLAFWITMPIVRRFRAARSAPSAVNASPQA